MWNLSNRACPDSFLLTATRKNLLNIRGPDRCLGMNYAEAVIPFSYVWVNNRACLHTVIAAIPAIAATSKADGQTDERELLLD